MNTYQKIVIACCLALIMPTHANAAGCFAAPFNILLHMIGLGINRIQYTQLKGLEDRVALCESSLRAAPPIQSRSRTRSIDASMQLAKEPIASATAAAAGPASGATMLPLHTQSAPAPLHRVRARRAAEAPTAPTPPAGATLAKKDR